MEMLARRTLEFYKQILMGDSGGSSEDQNTNKKVSTKTCVRGV